MKLPATLLLTYQAEYETTPDFTIDDLCQKYDVTTKQLKGHDSWAKRLQEPTKLPEPTETNNDIIANSNIDKPSTAETLDDIEEFKQLAIAHAVKFMKDDVRFAEVKEFKDMVAIVDSIEKSYKDTKPENTINIAIQNIVKEFKDDC